MKGQIWGTRCEKGWHPPATNPFKKVSLHDNEEIQRPCLPLYCIILPNLSFVLCTERCWSHIYNSKRNRNKYSESTRNLKWCTPPSPACTAARNPFIYKVHWDSWMRLVWTISSSSSILSSTGANKRQREERSGAEATKLIVVVVANNGSSVTPVETVGDGGGL